MPDRLSEIQARVERATPGPMVRSGVRYKLGGEEFLTVDGDGKMWALVPSVNTPKGQADAIADAEFIAHAWTDIPYLLSLVGEMREALKESRKAVSVLLNMCGHAGLQMGAATSENLLHEIDAALTKAGGE